MKVWYEPMGADMDGNRGVTLEMYELEKGDEEWVLPLLKEELLGYELNDVPDELTITTINPITEYDMEVELEMDEWMPKFLKVYPTFFEEE